MDNLETQRWIRESRQGNRTAFAELVRSHQQFAYGIAFRLLWDAQEAEDIVQETFVRIWRNLGRFDLQRSFTTWMYAIVANLCRDRLRERLRRPSARSAEAPLEELPDPVDLVASVSGGEIQQIVCRLTESLPLKQRLVFTLRDLQDLSVREVATALDISEASVKTNLHLARRKLRYLLTSEYSITGVQS